MTALSDTVQSLLERSAFNRERDILPKRQGLLER